MILTTEQVEDIKKGLTTSSDFNATSKERASEYDEQIIKNTLVPAYIEEGYKVLKKNKLQTRIGLCKKAEDLFEDEVWCLCADMGYTRLNKKRTWRLPFGKGIEETKQIDVFAVNNETILIVECKYTDTKGKVSDFKKELESYKTMLPGLRNVVKELFPEKNLKVKFVLATKNYTLSKTDVERISNLNGIHLSDDSIEYFKNLHTNIGFAAQYQFMGFMFSGESVPELRNMIPAIKASMGGINYYSFSIEPETLLKLSYVPHRSKASGKERMETYQRIVKGNRIKSIHQFINEEKGFFPNSIIINLVSDKPLQFDLSAKNECNTSARIGILHLPAKYKSAEIIDGQHRLLAYAGSQYACTHTIPVVAFENLDAEMQIKLFMQINQNQKPVDKNLRNTLNSIILEESKILSDRIKGLRLKIAEELATDENSWLYGVVGSGIDEGKITSTAIESGLNMDIYLGKIKKNELLEPGVFFKGDEEKAHANLRKFIFKAVQHLVENVSEIQQPGEDGLILINRGIYAYFRCIGDILMLLKSQGETLDKVDDIFDLVKPYLDPLFKFFNTKIKDQDEETVTSLKTIYGGGADTRYLRTYEAVIRETKKEFNPDGLDEYWAKFSKQRVDEAKAILSELEDIFKRDVVETLESEYQEKWFNKGVSLETAKIISNKVLVYNAQYPDNPTTNESVIDFIDCMNIVLQNWTLLGGKYALKGITGERKAKVEWLEKLATIKKNLDVKPFIDKENMDFLQEIKEQYTQI